LIHILFGLIANRSQIIATTIRQLNTDCALSLGVGAETRRGGAILSGRKDIATGIDSIGFDGNSGPKGSDRGQGNQLASICTVIQHFIYLVVLKTQKQI